MNIRKWLRSVVRLSFFIALLTGLSGIYAQAEEKVLIDIAEGDEWYFFKGKGEPPAKWNHIGSEKQDHEWYKGPTGLGYGHERARTRLEDMRGKYSGVYAMRDLTLSQGDYELVRRDSTKVTLSLGCDCSFKVWLNGVEVIRSGERSKTPERSLARPLEIEMASFARELLQKGSNVLAIWCANDCVDSDSFLFIPALKVRGE
jgi:hypothetical protein